MFDLTVVGKRGRWVLVDEHAGELGAFPSRAEALRAASAYDAWPGDEHLHILIHEDGEWEETVVELPRLN
jgi:hypothetical protein